MGLQKFFDNMIDDKVMNMDIAFIGRVLKVDNRLTTANIQPMNLIKQYGSNATAQAEIADVPILENAKYKMTEKSITYVKSISSSSKETTTVIVPEEIKVNDLVLCVCCDREITQAITGVNTLPEAGAHSKNNAIIVGII
jgi:hypothetical protein